MLDHDWLRAKRAADRAREDAVLICDAAKRIAARNPPMTEASILADLMRSYWNGCIELFELQAPRGCKDDQYGSVVRPRGRQRAPWSDFGPKFKWSDEGAGDPTLARRRSLYPREKLLMRLHWFGFDIQRNYRPGPATWAALAQMDPSQYDPDGECLINLRAEAGALAGWCTDNELKFPPNWRKNGEQPVEIALPVGSVNAAIVDVSAYDNDGSQNSAEAFNSAVSRPDNRPYVSKAALLRWYGERYQCWPEGKKPPNRDEDWSDAKKDFPDDRVTRVTVRNVRKAIATRWNGGGRPKASKENLAENLAEINLAADGHI